MISLLLATAATCLASVVLGQAALRLAGAGEWSWLAPPVGISLAMLLALPGAHVPGRCATTAAVVLVVALAAGAWCMRDPAHRPPAGGLLAALPVAGLTLVPFLAAGHAGTLGTSFNNDMAPHLTYVEAYLSQSVADVSGLPSDYPLGPHALVALLAKGLGLRSDEAFAGWTAALPILAAWTSLALVPRAAWLRQTAVATVVGMPFLVAAYYGAGAFKEVLQGTLVLAVALLLAGCGPALGRARWAPVAILTAGIVLVYSLTGLPWPVAFVGLFLLGQGVLLVARRTPRRAGRELRIRGKETAIGAAVALVLFVPLLPRIVRYVEARGGIGGTGIGKEQLGNLIGPLTTWEAFGVWPNPDFRIVTLTFPWTLAVAFAVALVLLGAAWALREGLWMLPVAAGAALLIWAISDDTQSPYVAAKALVIASPLLLALAIGPLVQDARRGSLRWTASGLLALALVGLVGVSSVRALRVSPVGPTDHLLELRSLRPLLHGQSTLFVGDDDFIVSELAGVPLGAAVINATPNAVLRPQKAWTYGQAVDIDSFDSATINGYDWVITTRNAAGSEPPPELRLERVTRSYALWRRTGRIAPREVLAEGQYAGAVLHCETPAGRALLRRGGVAAVRREPIAVPGPTLAPDTAGSIELPLTPGTWELSASYVSPRPLRVETDGLRTTLPANLDRPGQPWHVGRLTVRARGSVPVTFRTDKELLTPRSATATISILFATPVAQARVVPLRAACGRYVDWYRS